MPRLSQKTALVTGSTQGIGAAIALRFAREGADVVLNGRKPDGGPRELIEQIQALGRRAVYVPADIGTASAAAQLVERAVEALGGLDILVNNAGVERHADFWDVTEEDYDLVMDTNVKGLFFATQAFVRHRHALQRGGAVVNISSVHEEIAFPHFASYCASKGALRMLARNLASELAPLSIRINNVAPGAIATPINEKLLNDPAKLKALQAQIPMGRLGMPEDVAGLVAFLASEDAGYITGGTHSVDGGLTYHYTEQ
ncbi:glucose 1-dehydrogenase [Acidovorax sp. SUPP2522]|uniref:SDR family NAD(P)-dependent oxidoreductase n=1 Tax=unclassified Acidovorax TaxID=2684926 RepID=UPI00234A682D|nr:MULTISPECIES: 3-oxoacyl-ACP reductase family protein [unclassified Acidovorax]WCM98888.1 3-oxoacyl-ACP reductase FabG [Acidovorax sp. GBBC 1281]GKT20080.1 glucose 1-dehydrogenase [Acidovorax sp. SUPP2522]